jgi:hypothetical protein
MENTLDPLSTNEIEVLNASGIKSGSNFPVFLAPPPYSLAGQEERFSHFAQIRPFSGLFIDQARPKLGTEVCARGHSLAVFSTSQIGSPLSRPATGSKIDQLANDTIGDGKVQGPTHQGRPDSMSGYLDHNSSRNSSIASWPVFEEPYSIF